MSKPITSDSLTPATDAILAAARLHGQELEKTGATTFPGVNAARITALSGYTYSGYPSRYAVDSAACDAFWSARQARK